MKTDDRLKLNGLKYNNLTFFIKKHPQTTFGTADPKNLLKSNFDHIKKTLGIEKD